MAKRRPEFEGKPIPTNPVQNAPDAPSSEKLSERAKELKSKPRKPRKGTTQSAEEISKEIALADHLSLAETMARDTVDIINVGMSHMDGMYDREIQWYYKKKKEKLSFEFTKTEGETVGNACFSMYKKIDPAKLAALGGWMMGIALIGTVLLPRLKLVSELRQLREDLDDEQKKRDEAARGPAPAVTESRAPAAPAPSPAMAGVPMVGPDGTVQHVPTPD